MNEQSVTGIERLQRSARVACRAEFGIGKKQYGYFTCMPALFLLLIGSVLSSPLYAAVPEAPKVAIAAGAAEPDAQQAAIAAGVAAGTDISVIIQNAVAAGMTTEQAVEAIVTAGADPGRVVYEAITAKYPAETVVKCTAAAVNHQYCADTTLTPCSARVCTIVAAAIQAGESEINIHSWIASAGMPPTVIANAGAQACQGSAPVEGYSAPVAAAPLTAVIGGGGAPIGGSSVGAPGTQTASPSKP